MEYASVQIEEPDQTPYNRNMLLEGIIVPITTPFYPNERLYLRKLEHNVERYSRTPVSGMLVLGRTGEAEALTSDEMRTTLETAILGAAHDKVMIAGIGRESVFATLLLADVAAAAGYDAIALRGPMYAGEIGMRVEAMTYFQAIADRSALPVVLLSRVERPLAVEMVGALAGHPAILAVVEDRSTPERMARLHELTLGVSREVIVTPAFRPVTGRMLRQSAVGTDQGSFVSAASLSAAGAASATALAGVPPSPVIRTRTKRVGFQVLAGATGTMLSSWRAGANGAAPRLAACAPQACCEVWQAFKDGDLQLAEEKQTRIIAMGERLEGWAGIAAVKYACDLNGYFGGRPRIPLMPLTAEQGRVLEREMVSLKN